MLHLKLLEKQEHAKSKISRGREIKHKGLNQWNGDQKKKKRKQRIKETKNWFFEKLKLD
jgi:hypothetical protein